MGLFKKSTKKLFSLICYDGEAMGPHLNLGDRENGLQGTESH